MPRKQFRADLTAASQVPDFGHIIAVRPGDDDGDFTFVFIHPASRQESQITAMVDTSEYPFTHNYQLFAADDVLPAVATALGACPSLAGRPIQEALPLLSAFIASQTATGGRDDPLELDDDDYAVPESEALEDSTASDDGDNEDWALETDDFTKASGLSADSHTNGTGEIKEVDISAQRARADLRMVKEAGFKVGIVGTLSSSTACYISIACRIAKLGISEEAQDAWGITPSEYLLLLMYFPHGYRSLDFFESIDAVNGRTRLSMRVGISHTYRPANVKEASSAFADTHDDAGNHIAPQSSDRGLRECFISRPLNNLLNERLTTLLKYRLAMGFPWKGAEKYYNDNLGATTGAAKDVHASYMESEAPRGHDALAPLVTKDDLKTAKSTKELSFPLIAMQFLLRHFVRCTQFCLVCHSELDLQIEAIKPYVCDNPLCLYQYMALGFGPSIEHEIISQPNVVDLLISFCYASAASSDLSSYPDGLSLSVPSPDKMSGDPRFAAAIVPYVDPTDGKTYQTSKSPELDPTQLQARFDLDKLDLIFVPRPRCPLTKGQWIVINYHKGRKESWHCRVTETCLFPTVRVTKPIVLKQQSSESGKLGDSSAAADKLPTGIVDVRLHAYDQNFNDLNGTSKCSMIMMLLDLLPCVPDIQAYLKSRPNATLSQWTDRISPAALGILRWVIASNRSCIMQVDRLDENSSKKVEQRVEGVDGWLQFRFAMGAPDKEQRFINSVKAETASSKYPTLFAWHGSKLSNWHSIIREGLHFKKTTNGRAYGHGCYHAKDFGTSGGYSGMHSYYASGSRGSWSQSTMNFDQAIALSEIVNSPSKFVSSSPFYVVAQLDWIQTRYLFVHPQTEIKISASTPSITGPKVPQDPMLMPTGPSRLAIELPLSAIPSSRRKYLLPATVHGTTIVGSSGSKRPSTDPSLRSSKITKLTTDALNSIAVPVPVPVQDTVDLTGDDNESVATVAEDLEVLIELERPVPKQPAPPPPKKAPKSTAPSGPTTPFTITEISDLPLTPVPAYATTIASKRLQKDFRTLLATQQKHIDAGTLPELGWYVDPMHLTRTSNLYQWIAELHSFPLTLPLAQDLQKVNLQSVLLEIRFHATYPMSPPFVRVIRPRFLPFAMGGGGHVTAGGSICAELLTNDGWTAVSDIESVLLQIQMAIMSLEPKPARVESVALSGAGAGEYGGGEINMDYGVGEAVEAFRRACRMHGWREPEGLSQMTF